MQRRVLAISAASEADVDLQAASTRLDLGDRRALRGATTTSLDRYGRYIQRTVRNGLYVPSVPVQNMCEAVPNAIM